MNRQQENKNGWPLKTKRRRRRSSFWGIVVVVRVRIIPLSHTRRCLNCRNISSTSPIIKGWRWRCSITPRNRSWRWGRWRWRGWGFRGQWQWEQWRRWCPEIRLWRRVVAPRWRWLPTHRWGRRRRRRCWGLWVYRAWRGWTNDRTCCTIANAEQPFCGSRPWWRLNIIACCHLNKNESKKQ